MALTLFTIQNAKPRAKPYKLTDSRGLHLLVNPNGSKLWRLRYRFGGKQLMLGLGAFADVSLASARDRRDDARKLLAQGIDPSQQRKMDKLAASKAAQNTFGALGAEYIQRLQDLRRADATVSKNKWLIEELAKPLATRPIIEITPAEILDLLKKLERAGMRETARRLRGTIGSVFRFAIQTLRATNDPTYLGNYITEFGVVKKLIDRAKEDKRLVIHNVPVSVDDSATWPAKYAMTDREAAKAGKVSLEDMYNWYDRYGLEVIGYERTSFTEGMKAYLDSEARRRNKFLPLIELSHRNTNKQTRIQQSLEPRYSRKAIFHLTVGGVNQCEDLEGELLSFPKSPNDDTGDSAAYQSEVAQPPSGGREEVAVSETRQRLTRNQAR